MNTDDVIIPAQLQSKLRILLYIGELSTGGAERQFVELAKGLHRRGIPVAVMVNRPGGGFYLELEQSGIPISVLHMGGLKSIPRSYGRALDVINKFRPDIIYGFMGAGIKSTIISLLVGKVRIVWGVRSSDVTKVHVGLAHRISQFLDRIFSRYADAIIYNSFAGESDRRRLGWCKNANYIVPNGIDVKKYHFNSDVRKRLRALWEISNDEVLIGLVARLDAMKDHRSLILSLSMLRNNRCKLALIYRGDKDSVEQLHDFAFRHGVHNQIVWAGHFSDTSGVYSAFDIYVQSSAYAEGFPNSIGEAMSVGLPVVATDIGDCRKIIGDRGWIVPVKDPESLAKAVNDAVLALPNWSRDVSRQRIVDNYGVDAMVDNTLAVFNELMNGN